jgi:hypothetical protein
VVSASWTSLNDAVALPYPPQHVPPYRPGDPAGLSAHPAWVYIHPAGSAWLASHTFP